MSGELYKNNYSCADFFVEYYMIREVYSTCNIASSCLLVISFAIEGYDF